MKMRMNERTLKVVRAGFTPIKERTHLEVVKEGCRCMGYSVEVDNNLIDNRVHMGEQIVDIEHFNDSVHALQTLVNAFNRSTREVFDSAFSKSTVLNLDEQLDDPFRATGRTFRTLCKVMETASASKPGNVTFLIVSNGENNAVWCYSALNRLIHSYHGDSAKYEPQYRRIVLPQSRVIRVLTVEQASNPEHFRGRQSTVIHDHTCIK